MEIEDGRLVIKSQIILDFYRNNIDDKFILKGCIDVLEIYCRTMECNINDYANRKHTENQSNMVLEYIKDFERRQSGYNTRLENHITDVGDELVRKVEGRIGNMIISLDSAIGTVLERLNTDQLVEKISSIITRWIDANRGDLKGLEDNIINEMKNSVINPLGGLESRIKMDINTISNMLSKGADSDHGLKESMTRLDTDIKDNLTNLIANIRDIERNVIIKWRENNDSHHQNVPLVVKNVMQETIKDLEQQSHNIMIALNSTQQQMSKIQCDIMNNVSHMSVIKSNNDDIREKLDEMGRDRLIERVKSDNNTKLIGEEGERKLIDLLTDRLMMRDGYIVDKVSGQAQSCDIIIKREGYPSIRIESKAHGKLTGEKVRYKEVQKFQRDLLITQNHGIFVSLYSGVCGKQDFEIEQLMNGKFAIYLINNNFDVDAIVGMVRLLYQMDEIVKNNNTNGSEDEIGCVKLSYESIKRVETYVKDFNVKILSIKAHMKESISLLNELTLDLVTKVLKGCRDDDVRELKTKNYVLQKEKCGHEEVGGCGKEFKNKAALRSHAKHCKEINRMECKTMQNI